MLSGASTATLKGAGTLNRKGGYEFLASMVDGFAAAGGGDKIRVKIIKQVGDCALLLSVGPPACPPTLNLALHVFTLPGTYTSPTPGFRGHGL